MPNDGDKEIKQVTSGGVTGFLGLDQVDWGGEAGKFYECWKINPCCGSPDTKKMMCCFFCWCCCSCCSLSKLFASSVDQECALVPHCLMACFLPCITSICVRTNLRNRLGVKGNMMGDCICVWCCGCCSQCQELRSVPTVEWNLLEPAWKTPAASVPECIFIK
ncbi:transmembrane protein [Lotmaria passim]